MEKKPQEVYRRQRVMEYCRKHGNVSEAARRYGYSRKTLYKWLKRWDGSKESLYDRSRAPHRKARDHSEKELRLVRWLAKKHKWQDIIVAYQEACQRYEYPYCYETFKRNHHAVNSPTINESHHPCIIWRFFGSFHNESEGNAKGEASQAEKAQEQAVPMCCVELL